VWLPRDMPPAPLQMTEPEADAHISELITGTPRSDPSDVSWDVYRLWSCVLINSDTTAPSASYGALGLGTTWAVVPTRKTWSPKSSMASWKCPARQSVALLRETKSAVAVGIRRTHESPSLEALVPELGVRRDAPTAQGELAADLFPVTSRVLDRLRQALRDT
jgi:hypothetical protein